MSLEPEPDLPASLSPDQRRGARGVFGNAGVLLTGKGANVLVSLAYLAVTARALGIEAFGVLVLVHTFAQTLGELAQFQSWQTVIHYGSRPAAEGDKATLQRVVRFTAMLDLISGVGGAVLGLLIAGVAARQLGWPEGVKSQAMGYVTIVIFMVSATPVGVLRLFGRFDILALQSPVNSLVRLGAALLAWWLGGGLGAFLVVWYLGQAAGFLLMFGAAGRELSRRGMLAGFDVFKGPLTEGLDGVWKFAWTTNLNTTLELTFTRAGLLIVGAVLTPAAAALFRIGWQVGNAIANPAKMVVNALYPELARLWVEQDHAALRALVLRVGLVCGSVGTVLLLISSLVGGPLLGLVLGRDFSAAAGVMTWLVAAAVINAWVLPLEPLLISTGQPGIVVRVRLVVSAAYLIAVFPLVHAYGLTGAGAASVIYATLMAVGLLIPVAVFVRKAPG